MRRGWPDLPRSEWERLISEWILKDSYRDIMRRYLCDGWTQEKIAERAGLSLNGTKKHHQAVHGRTFRAHVNRQTRHALCLPLFCAFFGLFLARTLAVS